MSGRLKKGEIEGLVRSGFQRHQQFKGYRSRDLLPGTIQHIRYFGGHMNDSSNWSRLTIKGSLSSFQVWLNVVKTSPVWTSFGPKCKRSSRMRGGLFLAWQCSISISIMDFPESQSTRSRSNPLRVEKSFHGSRSFVLISISFIMSSKQASFRWVLSRLLLSTDGSSHSDASQSSQKPVLAATGLSVCVDPKALGGGAEANK